MKNYKNFFGIISATMVFVSLGAQLFILKDFPFAKNFGYLEYFLASYFGGSLIILPFLVKTLNPFLFIS